MKNKKIDFLRLILVQFDVMPICEQFKISELDVFNMLSTRYFNKFSKYDLFCFLKSYDIYNTPIANDLFSLGATRKELTPYMFFYLNDVYKKLGLGEKFPHSNAGKTYNQVLSEVFNAQN